MKQVIPAAAIALMASSTAFAFVWSFDYAADYRSWTCEEENRLGELCSRNASAYRVAKR